MSDDPELNSEPVDEPLTEEVTVRLGFVGMPVLRRWRPNPQQMECLLAGGDVVFVKRDMTTFVEGGDAFDITTEIREVRVVS